jgi:hypothetical protein
MPSSVKNAFTASRSSTTMSTLSIRLSVMCLLVVPAARVAALHLVSGAGGRFSTWPVQL